MAATGAVLAGKYLLTRRLGEGGMATVWEAVQQPLERPVAVKVLGEEVPGLGFARERFLEEAKAAAAVRHPHVVEILDYGTTPEGQPFMVMELLNGGSLADRIEARAPFPPAEAIGIAREILGALSAVHAEGIVHRDLKPENVLFPDARRGPAKVVDFGISKNLQEEAEGRRRPKTREGLAVGTPEYMAPEQAGGRKVVDHRADLYAVGVLLYEMLSAVRPFEGDDLQAILLQVLAGQPRPLGSLRAGLPPRLLDVVERAMAHDPGERYGDAKDMERALAEVLVDAERPRSHPPPWLEGAPPRDTLPREAGRQHDAPANPSEPAPSLAESTADRELRISRTEPPDPRSMELPQPEVAQRRRLALLAVLFLALLVAPEIAWPGVYGRLARGLRAPVWPEGASRDALADAGPRGPDGGWVEARLRGVPEGASVFLEGELTGTRPGTEVGERVLSVPARAGPYEVVVEHEGQRWSGRRWGLRDVVFHVRLR